MRVRDGSWVHDWITLVHGVGVCSVRPSGGLGLLGLIMRFQRLERRRSYGVGVGPVLF